MRTFSLLLNNYGSPIHIVNREIVTLVKSSGAPLFGIRPLIRAYTLFLSLLGQIKEETLPFVKLIAFHWNAAHNRKTTS